MVGSFIDSGNDTRGVHSLSPEIKTLLEEKHPKEKEVCDDVLLPQTANDPEPVIYEEIDGTAVTMQSSKADSRVRRTNTD